jgi:hypothetical protein
MCHWPELGHFTTFSPRSHFKTTITHNTASHKRSGLNYRSSLFWSTEIFVCISDINSLYFGVWWRRDWGSHLSFYYHVNGSTHAIKSGNTVVQMVEAIHFKLTGREFQSRLAYWEYSLTNSFRCTVVLVSSQPITQMMAGMSPWG